MTFFKVSKVLEKKIKKRSTTNLLLSSAVCFQALRISEGLFEPISFKDGVLFVSVSDSSSASQIQLSGSQIIEKINQKLGQNIVKRIRIRISH